MNLKTIELAKLFKIRIFNPGEGVEKLSHLPIASSSMNLCNTFTEYLHNLY